VLAEPWPIVAQPEDVSDTYLLLDLVYVAFVIGLPTGFAAAILQRLREKESALLARTEQLVEASRQKSQFMANVTHELRTPLQGIIGMSDLVAKGLYEPPAAMGELKASAKRLLALIDDLLELSRHDAGRVELKLADVDVRDVVTTTTANAQWLLGGKQLAIDTDVPALPAIKSDRAKVAQIVLNLLANAIKFTPEGGAIAVRARATDTGVAISVSDTGVGIPAAELERVFDEFHQVDGSSSREFGGVGLGLSLVKQIAERHGGSVRCEARPGGGSRFVMEIAAA